MANKIFYWLKFKNDFFSSLRIKKLRKEHGDTCLVIYLRLQLFALETDGVLEYKGIFSSFAVEMAEELGEDYEKVKEAIDYLLSCGLMEQEDDKYILPFVRENTGSESESAGRMRTIRSTKKESQCANNVTDVSENKDEISNNEVTKCEQCANNVTDDFQNNDESVTMCEQSANNVQKCANKVTLEIRDKSKEIRDKNIYNKISSKEDIRSSQISKNVEIAVEMWNGLSDLGINPVSRITEGTVRHKNLCARLKQYSIDEYRKAIGNIRNSDFLLGKVNDFQITFDWFVKPSNFIKVLDGNYSKNNNKTSSGLSDRWKGDS